MNVYDFDNTLYDGESAYDFFMFLIKRKPSFLRLFPLMIIKLTKYKLCLVTYDELKKYIEKYAGVAFFSFDNFDDLVIEFWDTHFHKIKSIFNINENDIVLSASFRFLLEEPIKRLGIKTLICSDIDTKTAKLKSICFQDKKVEFLKPYLNDEEITFYTDSMNDKAIIDFAKHAYFVKGNKITKIK